MTKKRGRVLPPDTPPERHGVVTLTVKVQGTNLTVDMNVMGELNIGELASVLEFRARTARQQVGVEAAKAELLPRFEALQRQVGEAEHVTEPPTEPPDLKRRRRRTAAA